jgi:hypothetical protein
MEQLIDQVVNLRKLENAFVTYPFSESPCDANPCVCVRSAMALLDVDLGVHATIALLSYHCSHRAIFLYSAGDRQ